MKNSIDIGLAVRSAIRCREQCYDAHTYEEIADDIDCCSWQALYMIGERALKKMRKRLESRGVTKEEAMMALEMMTKQGCYRSPHEEICPHECPLANT